MIVAATASGLLEKLQESNGLLEKINKGLNAYLEKKRLFFPRYIHVAISHVDLSTYIHVIGLVAQLL